MSGSSSSSSSSSAAAAAQLPGVCNLCGSRVPDSPLVRLQPCAHVVHLDCTIDRVLARTNCPLCRDRFRGAQIADNEDAQFVNRSRLAISWRALVRLNRMRMEAAAAQPPASQAPDSPPPAYLEPPEYSQPPEYSEQLEYSQPVDVSQPPGTQAPDS